MAVVEEALVFKDAYEVVFDVAGLAVLGALAEGGLRGAIEQVAGGVVLEGFAVGRGQPGWRGKGLAGGSFNSAGGVVAVGAVALQAV